MCLPINENNAPVFSSVYYGEVPFYKEIAKHEQIFIDPYERYKKQTWRSRTQILTGNGPLILSIPIQRIHGKNTLMKEALISEDSDWRKDHWKAIESAYMHAPYFFYYGDQIKELIYHQNKYLMDFNQKIFRQILDWLDLNIEVQLTNKYIDQDLKNDFRVILDQKQFNCSALPYIQVFSDKLPFVSNLSIIDLLMNEGPLARKYIME